MAWIFPIYYNCIWYNNNHLERRWGHEYLSWSEIKLLQKQGHRTHGQEYCPEDIQAQTRNQIDLK